MSAVPPRYDVSVVIPTRNRAALCLEAVRSCLGSSVRVEVIVVDDGGEDNTAALLAGLPDVRYVRQEWAGRAAARNRGTALATAPLVAYLDSDDICLPGRFERLLARLEPAAGAVFGQIVLVDEDGTTVLSRNASLQREVAECGAAGATPEVLAVRIRIYPSALIVRREVLAAIGGWDEAFRVAEDVELLLRIARHTRIAYEPEPVAAIRVHGGNTSSDLMFREQIELADKLLRLWDLPARDPLRARLLFHQSRALWSLHQTTRARTSAVAALRADPTVLREENFAKQLVGSLLPEGAVVRARHVLRQRHGG